MSVWVKTYKVLYNPWIMYCEILSATKTLYGCFISVKLTELDVFAVA